MADIQKYRTLNLTYGIGWTIRRNVSNKMRRPIARTKDYNVREAMTIQGSCMALK